MNFILFRYPLKFILMKLNLCDFKPLPVPIKFFTAVFHNMAVNFGMEKFNRLYDRGKILDDKIRQDENLIGKGEGEVLRGKIQQDENLIGNGRC